MADDVSIRVAIAGARGSMGCVAVAAFAASNEFRYVGGFARDADPAQHLYASLEALLADRKPDVLLDFTTRPMSVEAATKAALAGVRPVVAASGWTDEERDLLAGIARDRDIGAMIVPNFCAGAVLMMRFAAEAARYFQAAEIVEMHRVEKRDRPSGTARETASRMQRAGGNAPTIHSIRLPGLVAHQEVLLGGEGELLTIRHDSFTRNSFVPGMFAAVRAVMSLRGLHIGLDSIFDQIG